jgi:hypothetical protein
MSTEITKKGHLLTTTSSFEGWTDDVVTKSGDDERPTSAGLIKGTLLKFGNDFHWRARGDDTILDGKELGAVGVERVVQKWQNNTPVETRILGPGEPFPDIDELNEETPREEWAEKFGKFCGPWQAQHILYLLCLLTMEMFTFPTGTDGGRIAIRELREKVSWMQRLRGSDVYPLVALSDTFFPTGFGGRQRPFFKIVRWVRLGGQSKETEFVPGPTTPQVAPPAAQVDLPLAEVAEPTLKEELNDNIDDILNAVDETPAAPPAKPAPKTAPSTAAKAPVKRRAGA